MTFLKLCLIIIENTLNAALQTSNDHYLTDHSDDDVIVVGGAPAQEVGTFCTALVMQFVGGIIRTEEKENKPRNYATFITSSITL